MVIDSYSIGMESARRYSSSFSARVSSAVAVEGGNLTGGQLSSFTDFLPQGDDSEKEKNKEEVKYDDNLNDALNKLGGIKPKNYVSRGDSTLDSFHKLREMCIRHIFDMLFGHGISSKDKDLCSEEMQPSSGISGELRPSYQILAIAGKVQLTQTFSEEEATSFSTKGTVKTADGREIDFGINVSMSRSFTTAFSSTNIITGLRYIDPLVVNLDVGSANISDQNFYFDIDSDGTEEKLKGLAKGSGFLALDKNEDGKINDGSELFGTKSGDGFKDLAEYDSDHNGWIDEKDEIFSKLKIWVKDENGNDTLYSLKDKNVGAIYLGSTDTEFSLTKGGSSDADAIIRKTGMFLFEDGNAGTIQHIDLVS